MEVEPTPVAISSEENPGPAQTAVPSEEMDHESTPTTVSPEGNPESTPPTAPPEENPESTPQTTSPEETSDSTPEATSSNSDSESTAPTSSSEEENEEDDSSTPTAKSSKEELESQILAAAASGDLDLTKSLFPTDLLTKIASKGTKAGHPSILSWALENGLTIPSESTNNPVFHAAFESGSIPIFQTLLEHGVDLEKHSSDYYGDALAHACMKGNLPLIKFLLEKGHGVNLGRRCNGRVGVVWAVTHDSFSESRDLKEAEKHGLEIIKLLLSHGLNVEGTGAAIAAAEKDNKEALIMILDAGASMEEVCNWRGGERDKEEGTALFRACLRGKDRTVDYLLGRGAKRDVFSWEGRGCYEVAEQKGYKNIIQLLDQIGVTVEWPD
jgi:ankyrin repeat protein